MPFDKSSFLSSARQAITLSQHIDEEKEYLIKRAPNAIEWMVSKQYANRPDNYRYWGTYRLVKEFFELRCPTCNDPNKIPADPWGLSRETLESEVLLVWSERDQDDICSKCGTTRAEFIEREMFNNNRILHLVAGQRCVSLNAQIYTSNGLLSFDDLLGNSKSIDHERSLDVQVETFEGRAKCVGVTYVGLKPSVKITTELSYTQECGEDHPVAVWRDGMTWIKSRELKLGDCLMLRRGAELFGQYKLKPSQARVLGCLVANGSVSCKKWVKFSHQYEDVVAKFCSDIAEGFPGFGHKDLISYQKSTSKDSYETSRGLPSFRAALLELGLTYSRSHDKTVPLSVLCGDRDTVIEFLRGYLSCDGFAYLASSGKKHPSKKINIGCSSVSRILIEQVRMLLLNLGVITRLEVSKSVKYNSREKYDHNSYLIRVHPSSVVRFGEVFSFIGSEKNKTLSDCVHAAMARKPKRRSGVPRCDDPRWYLLPITSLEKSSAMMADLRVPDGECYVANGILNHNSGKSETLGLLSTYIEHCALVTAHSYQGGLQGYLGQPLGTQLQLTLVASTATQSKDTIWAKYRNYRRTSPWFQRYVPWIMGQQKIQTTPKGMQPWEYTEGDTVIKNGFVNLICNSKNSNSHGLAGATRIASIIDEISRMKNTESGSSAREIYRTLDASCQTAQSASETLGLPSWFGMVASITSPFAVDDYGMQLLETAKTTPRMYADRRPTWEYNPEMPYEFFEDMIKKDPVGTMRNFGARPAGAASPFIDRPQDFLNSAVDKNLKPTATFRHYEFTDPTGRSLLGVKLDRAELIIGGTPRYLAVDAGANFDAFSVACAHGETDKDGNTITVFDWVIRLLTRSKKQEVYFESVYQLLKDMQSHLMIRQIEFDHWNSKMIVQRIRNDFYQTRAEEVVTTNEHFINFMRDAYSGYVRMLPALEKDAALDPPYKSAQGAAIYEILGLERDPKNDKIFNSMKGRRRGFSSDDTARVIVHAHRLVQEQGYTKKQDDNSKSARRKKAEHSLASWVSQGRGQVVNLGSLGKTRPPA